MQSLTLPQMIEINNHEVRARRRVRALIRAAKAATITAGVFALALALVTASAKTAVAFLNGPICPPF